MDRFILRYRGRGTKPADAVERLRRAGATVLDDSSPRMVLVEAREDALRAALDQEPDWVMSRERSSYQVPPSHPVRDRANDLKPPE